MPDHLSGLPRPRTIVHPGTYGAVRIEHMQAARGRHFRLSLPQGRSLYDSIVEALASVDVHNASMTLLDGDLEALSFCLARPDATGRVVAAYTAPELSSPSGSSSATRRWARRPPARRSSIAMGSFGPRRVMCAVATF